MIDIQSVLPGLTPSRRDQGGCLAPWQTSRGGVPFGKKKIALHQGSPRRDKGFRTKADLAWGGTLWKFKYLFVSADASHQDSLDANSSVTPASTLVK